MMMMMMRRLADVDHHARGRELRGGASTSLEAQSSTLSQLFKPIKYAAIVSY